MKSGVLDAIFANITVRLQTPAKRIWQMRSKANRSFRGSTSKATKKISYAVSCRHCEDPMCVKSCIAGAITREDDLIHIDQSKCVGCYTCILVCPYGALATNENGVMQKCELCLQNSCGAPACVTGCPNNAIVYEERGEENV